MTAAFTGRPLWCFRVRLTTVWPVLLTVVLSDCFRLIVVIILLCVTVSVTLLRLRLFTLLVMSYNLSEVLLRQVLLPRLWCRLIRALRLNLTTTVLCIACCLERLGLFALCVVLYWARYIANEFHHGTLVFSLWWLASAGCFVVPQILGP